jgi:histidinol-phosphate/aromatic aminotransferase/cobyric acid decarboxylase-like protein
MPVHAARPDAPVVLVPAYRMHGIEAQAATRPFLTVLSKPPDNDQLHALVRQLMIA